VEEELLKFVKESKVSRDMAKKDVKSGISREIKRQIPFKHFSLK